jgi:NAD(P)-dependent dehydrogenase (short-subunit alcohol dehydrogenase family)
MQSKPLTGAAVAGDAGEHGCITPTSPDDKAQPGPGGGPVGDGRLAGKVAIVTGGTSVIGAETARRFVQEGARVIITGRSRERGDELAHLLGSSLRFECLDLTGENAPAQVIEAALHAYGRVDVLVNNAALDHTGELLHAPMPEVREVFEINVFAALRMLQAAAQSMTGAGGSIVNVTSRLASIGVPSMGIYSASKGAMLALTRAAAVELAPSAIRVNAVAPGMTHTPLFDAWLASQAERERIMSETVAAVPQGRLAEPADVAAAILYLASDEALHVTGASLAVDGGYTAA